MPFISIKCPQCGVSRQSVRYEDVFSTRTHTLTCGHLWSEELIEQKTENIYQTFKSQDGKSPFPYQIEGALFAERSNIRCLFGDEMALGKTVEELIVLRAHPELLPCALICKSAVKAQYAYEILRWIPEHGMFTQVIEGSKGIILPGMKFYIFSFDILRRFRIWKCPNGHIQNKKVNGEKSKLVKCSTKDCGDYCKEHNTLVDKFKELGIKSIIIDECQLIKNTDTARATELRELVKDIPHIMASSGSAIENNAAEYFSILNILKPEKFRAKQSFINQWCSSYWTGYNLKIGGIRRPQEFKAYTSDFIIRRTRKEVLPELPEVNRQFMVSSIEDDDLGKAYTNTSNQLVDYAEGTKDDTFTKYSNIMSYLAKMRHIVGLSKVNQIVDYVDEFLETTDRKITIFIHHLDVGNILNLKLSVVCKERGIEPPTQLVSELNSDERLALIDEFGNNGKHRVMIASTLSAAEGLNFQKWCDCIIAEQQWNPMKEKQAEDRFPRVGQESRFINAVYFIVIGTVDEYLAELKEQKRQSVKSAIDAENIKWDEQEIIKLVTQRIIDEGRKKWTPAI